MRRGVGGAEGRAGSQRKLRGSNGADLIGCGCSRRTPVSDAKHSKEMESECERKVFGYLCQRACSSPNAPTAQQLKPPTDRSRRPSRTCHRSWRRRREELLKHRNHLIPRDAELLILIAVCHQRLEAVEFGEECRADLRPNHVDHGGLQRGKEGQDSAKKPKPHGNGGMDRERQRSQARCLPSVHSALGACHATPRHPRSRSSATRVHAHFWAYASPHV